MMRHLILVGLLCLVGCQNLRGPFAPRGPKPDPSQPISEQKTRGRDRYALPDDTKDLPPAETGLPGVHGR